LGIPDIVRQLHIADYRTIFVFPGCCSYIHTYIINVYRTSCKDINCYIVYLAVFEISTGLMPEKLAVMGF
jgi:hypothetical protein